MVEVRVAEDHAQQARVRILQSRNRGHDRRAIDRQAKIQQQPLATALQLDAVAADLVGAVMDAKAHASERRALVEQRQHRRVGPRRLRRQGLEGLEPKSQRHAIGRAER